MVQNNKLNKFLEFFTNNAVGVLTTITNEQLELNSTDEIPFDFEIIQKAIDIPLVFLSVIILVIKTFNYNMLYLEKWLQCFQIL